MDTLRRLLPIVLLTGFLLPQSPAHAADSRPPTIPALREWTAGTGTFQWTSASRIVLDPADQWGTTGVTVADDVEAMTGVRPAVVTDTPRAGDLYLRLREPDSVLGQEGYRLEVTDRSTISARTTAGAFYGTRTVLQLMRRTGTIPRGTARDWPTLTQRGVWIDTTARYFPLPWWKNLIRELAWAKLNEIGFQWYGEQLPSDTELADLIAFAARYHVNITPQRQLASHADLDILKEHPDYFLDRNAPVPANGAFDFTKPGALDIAREAIEETLARFPGKYFHAGGDEYLSYGAPPWNDYPRFAQFARAQTGNPNATGEDAFDWYFNWINGIVKSHGRTLSMWNDTLLSGGVVRLDRDIIVDYWRRPPNSGVIRPQALVDAGNRVTNSHSSYLYYNQSERWPHTAHIYDSWTPYGFHNPDGPNDDVVTGPNASNVFGTRIAVWTYEQQGRPPESNDEIAARLYPPLRALAQRAWGTSKLEAYPTWGPFWGANAYSSLVSNLGHAPGTLTRTPTHGTGPGGGLGLEPGGELAVVRNVGGAVRHGVQEGPARGPWHYETFPTGVLASLAGEPVTATNADGSRTIVARKTDGQLVQATQVVGGSGPWQYRTIGQAAAGRPAIVVDAQRRLALVARTTAGTLLYGREAAPRGPWTFTTIGANVAGDPALALDSGGRLAILFRATNGRLAMLRQTGPGSETFGVTADLGPSNAQGTPALASDRNGRLAYFVRGASGSLHHGRLGTTWSLQQVATGVASDPASLLDRNGRLVWFARRTDGHLQHGWEATPGGPAFTVEDLGAGLVGDVAAANDISGKLTYFVAETSGRIRHGYQTIPGNGPWATCLLEVNC